MLVADGLGTAADLQRSVVLAQRQVVQPMSLIADNGHQRLRTGSGYVADRMKSSPPQGLLRHLADAPQAAHRQGR